MKKLALGLALGQLMGLNGDAFAGTLSQLRSGPFFHEREDTAKKSNANVGKYLYVGNVPRFEANELELYVSKMSLNLRVKAWVSQTKIDGYAQHLLNRFEKINEIKHESKVSYYPLLSVQKYAQSISNQATVAWMKIAEQYMKHSLDNTGVDIYEAKRNSTTKTSEQYKENIALATLRFLFLDNSLKLESIENDNALKDKLVNTEASRKLFSNHLGSNFTKDQSRTGYVGFLTFIYPIAATAEGPFSQPKEQVTDLKLESSMEARWWSDKWQDEFGGFPFILIEWSGVAFHGPITNKADIDAWYLRRGYVSHGCHRMDASDLLELRAMFPSNLKDKNQKIKTVIMDHFDVTDWDNDGTVEAMDVKYYNIPSQVSLAKGASIDATIKPFLIENQMKTFLQHSYAKGFYDSQKDVLKNIPAYKVNGYTVVKSGTHAEVKIKHFEARKTSIIQYQEEGVKRSGYDDVGGFFPPGYFQK